MDTEKEEKMMADAKVLGLMEFVYYKVNHL